MHDIQNQLLTVNDVAGRWQLGPRTVRDKIKSGTLPACRQGRTHRIRAADMWACEGGPFPRGLAQQRALNARSGIIRSPVPITSDQ